MPFDLIKEDGTAKPDANCYADVTDCDAYHLGHLYSDAWDAATDDDKKAALIMATRLIDSEYQFGGTKVLMSQALQWPRLDCPEPDGATAVFTASGGTRSIVVIGDGDKIQIIGPAYTVPGDIIPKAVVEATCEMARELLIVDRTAAPAGEGLKYYNNAGIQTGYDKTDRRPVISHIAQAMLAKYGSLLTSKSGAVRLQRV